MKWLVKKHFEVLTNEDGEESRGEFLNYEPVIYTDAGMPRGTQLEFDYVLLEGPDTEEPQVEIDGDGHKTIVSGVGLEKEATIAGLYETMYDNVLEGMKSTFGTTRPETAAANAATWEAMIKRPANYIDADLGLLTVEDVTVYATSKLAAADAYGVYRLKLMAGFVAGKQAVLDD